METNNSLTIPIYTFYCDESLLKKVESTFKDQNWIKDNYNYNTEQYYHEELFSWIDSCVSQVKQIYYNNNLKLVISSCWVNKNDKLMKSPLHNHTNSILSGVLYFSEEKTSPLVFHFPNPYLHLQYESFLHLSDIDRFYIKHPVLPKRGMLIIFPSTILHETLTHKETHARYSLAFNTFVDGQLSVDPTKKLIINTTPNNL